MEFTEYQLISDKIEDLAEQLILSGEMTKTPLSVIEVNLFGGGIVFMRVKDYLDKYHPYINAVRLKNSVFLTCVMSMVPQDLKERVLNCHV